jgi:nucleoid-associated protein YgaU
MNIHSSELEFPERMTMTKYSLLRGLVITSIAGTMAGCATAPTQEMSDARQAVQAAREAGAPAHTPVVMDNAEQDLSQAEHKLSVRDYKDARNNAMAARQEAVKARNMALAIAQAEAAISEAQELGALTQVTRDWMTKAKAASSAGDEEEVTRATQRAKQEAQDDIRRYRDEKQRAELEDKQRAELENQEWLRKVTPILDQVREAAVRLTSEQQEVLRRGEEAYRQHEGRQAYDLVRAVLTAVLALPPLPRILQYQVEQGDNLWSIAAKRSVYGNPLWWPLILRSNRAQIPDADTIDPGQLLNIELDPDKALVDMAVRHAQRREGTEDQMKELDRQFLRDAK